MQYIPVYGGVTYACKDSFAAVWGFDTMHPTSEQIRRINPGYIRECPILYHGLKVAEKL